MADTLRKLALFLGRDMASDSGFRGSVTIVDGMIAEIEGNGSGAPDVIADAVGGIFRDSTISLDKDMSVVSRITEDAEADDLLVVLRQDPAVAGARSLPGMLAPMRKTKRIPAPTILPPAVFLADGPGAVHPLTLRDLYSTGPITPDHAPPAGTGQGDSLLDFVHTVIGDDFASAEILVGNHRGASGQTFLSTTIISSALEKGGRRSRWFHSLFQG